MATAAQHRVQLLKPPLDMILLTPILIADKQPLMDGKRQPGHRES